ncbi:MAG: pantoate--beta-alanine ligase [Calditerrivibrio sp.]|nr:pantoate--beta-alanine ligase [Calditerrivibrio sp.]
MLIVNTVCEAKKILRDIKNSGKSIGFVPTMGYLHSGHISLVDQSKKDNDFTVVSIFVNPTQFGPNEDLDKYPRDFVRDEKLLRDAGVDMVFYPSVETMYPDGYATFVNVERVTDPLCGAKRPGHFRGVATIVCKLFNIVSPDKSYFGLKDYQQVIVIKRMVEDLNMDVDVVGMPIVRESDGLAMSSRNVYLSPDERLSALSLSRSFPLVEKKLKSGERRASVIIKDVEDFISSHPYSRIDYVEIVDKDSLEKLDFIDRPFLIAMAVFINKTRLIDNKIFEV